MSLSLLFFSLFPLSSISPSSTAILGRSRQRSSSSSLIGYLVLRSVIFFFSLCKDESSLRPLVARVDRSSPHDHLLLLLTVEA